MKGGLLAGFVGLGVIVAAPWAQAQQAAAPASSATFNDAPPPAPAAPVAPAPAPEPAPVPATSGLADSPPAAAPAGASAAPAAAPAPPAPVAQPYTAPAADDGEEEPSTGLGPMIAGWAVTAVGVGNLAAIPICSADFYPHDAKDACIVASIAVGVAGLGVGIPLLIVGYSKRSTYNEWRSRHPLSSRLMNTQVALQNNSAVLLYRGSF